MFASASCVASTTSSTVSAPRPTASAHSAIRPRTVGSCAGSDGAAGRNLSGSGPRASAGIYHSQVGHVVGLAAVGLVEIVPRLPRKAYPGAPAPNRAARRAAECLPEAPAARIARPGYGSALVCVGADVDRPANAPDRTWLIAVAAALWGTDGLLRQPLTGQLPAATIVFWEHLLIVVVLVPFLPSAVRAFRAANGRE